MDTPPDRNGPTWPPDRLQWSHGLSAMDTGKRCEGRVGQQRAFNGATASQPWILQKGFHFLPNESFLQWSHGLSAMDTSEGLSLSSQRVVPSMEPRPLSHGYVHPMAGHILGGRQPSMEPRPLSHGYVHPMAGHILGGRQPSMEPRPLSHGYTTKPAGAGSVAWCPSMEPRPLSHGYEHEQFMRLRENIRLQWSHGLSAMDTPASHTRTNAAPMPSMEPRPLSHGYYSRRV